MRKGLFSGICMLSLCSVVSVQAADGVYVDLSVLENMPKDSIGFVSSQPLFPIVKKQPVQKIRKAKKRPQKKVLEAVKPVVTEELKPVSVITETEVVSTDPEPVKIDAVNVESEYAEEISAVSVSENATTETPSQSITEETLPTEENTVQENTEVSEEPVVPQNIAPEEPLPGEIKNASLLPPVVEKTDVAEEPLLPVNASAPVVSENNGLTVIDNNPVAIAAPSEVLSLLFREDEYEVSSENAQKLDALSASFTADLKSKIAIRAYNYNAIEDSFGKKRISLNRATEVRSYLLNKGYKNFSIKVVNIDDEDKRNTVEVEELKN